jgi:hypothetical protein
MAVGARETYTIHAIGLFCRACGAADAVASRESGGMVEVLAACDLLI